MCNRNRCRRSDVTGRGTVGHDNGDKCCVASPGSVTWRVTHDGQHVTRDSQRTSAPHRAILRLKSSIYSVVKCGNKVKQLGTLRGSYCSSQNISEMNKENAIMHSMHASNCGHFWTRDKTQNASLAPCTAHCTCTESFPRACHFVLKINFIFQGASRRNKSAMLMSRIVQKSTSKDCNLSFNVRCRRCHKLSILLDI